MTKDASSHVTVRPLDQQIRYLPLTQQVVDYDKRYKKGWCYAKQPNRFLEQHATSAKTPDPAARATALVPGCGYGRNALHLSKLNYEVTGVDTSLAGIEKAGLLYRSFPDLPPPTFVHADINDYPLAPNSFDLIVLIYTPLLAAFPKLFAALKPGGRIILECFAPLMHDLNLKNNTNYGPPLASLLSVQALVATMPRLLLEIASEETIELHEGSFHRVKEAGVLRVVGRKSRWDAICDAVTPDPDYRPDGDLYLANAPAILQKSLQFAREHAICCYCWTPQCHCARLRQVYEQRAVRAEVRPFSVTIVTHPVEFMRGTNTTRILPDILAAFSVDAAVHIVGSSPALPDFSHCHLLYPGGTPISEVPSATPLHLLVPDGTWAHTKAMLATFPQLSALPRVSLLDGDVAEYESRLIETLNAGSGKGRITTAEAVGMAVGGGVLARVKEGVGVVSGEYQRRVDEWTAAMEGLGGGESTCESAPERTLALTKRLEQYAVGKDVPLNIAGVRWCRVCGVGMGSGKRMTAHVRGRKHCENVALRARGMNCSEAGDAEIWTSCCKAVMAAELAEPGDWAVTMVEREVKEAKEEEVRTR